jgi:predicted DCC family thiol-disulfide oxidoreductase YuxK
MQYAAYCGVSGRPLAQTIHAFFVSLLKTSHLSESLNILLFDGTCGFCNRSVQLLLKLDKKKKFRFAALQSDIAAEKLQYFGCAPNTLPDSLVLINSQGVFTQWIALRKIAQKLGGLWHIPSTLSYLIPVRLGNILYDFIARNRHRLPGKKDFCLIPSEEDRKRFLG